jgi:hypothetical protein
MKRLRPLPKFARRCPAVEPAWGSKLGSLVNVKEAACTSRDDLAQRQQRLSKAALVRDRRRQGAATQGRAGAADEGSATARLTGRRKRKRPRRGFVSIAQKKRERRLRLSRFNILPDPGLAASPGSCCPIAGLSSKACVVGSRRMNDSSLKCEPGRAIGLSEVATAGAGPIRPISAGKLLFAHGGLSR